MSKPNPEKIPEEIAKFLEDAIGMILTYGADKIAVAAINDDQVITCYHNCVMGDKITIAGFVQIDANFDFLKVNAGRIKELLEEEAQPDA